VGRFAGVRTGIVLGAVGALGIWWADPQPSRRAPGPLAEPHRQADLGCASCHQDEQPVAAACVGCHGPHASTRPGHQRLRDEGRLGCPDCHRVHRDFGGVRFDDEGVTRFVPGHVAPVDRLASRVHEGGTVAIVPAAACSACHDPDRSTDPIARCLVAGQEELGPERPTVCFDEHRPSRGEGSRLALWEAAREVAARAPTLQVPAEENDRSWLWLVGLPWGAFGLVATGWAGAQVLRRRPTWRATTPVVAVPVEPPTVRRLPQVDTSTCIGCNACVDACPYDVLELRRYVAVVARPDDCCGLTTCQERCPNGSLVVTDGEPIEQRPRIGADLQSLDVPGVFIAGDLTGLPLIRNAINQGALTVRSAAALVRSSATAHAPDVHDLVVIGAGPAGLSASLEAKAQGLRHVVLEQGSVAESIRSFPRGKLVFDQPLEVPLVGELWLRESTKEELLGHWLRLVRRHRLPIVEGHRVVAIDRTEDGHLCVRAIQSDPTASSASPSGEQTYLARTVIVSIGRRGSPRKLPIPVPDAVAHRVHYSLADAQTFAGRHVVVVGLGDVAMETAIALAGQPGTTVTVVHRGETHRRGKRRNIDAITRLATTGRIDLLWRTQIESLAPQTMTLRTPTGPREMPWDATFVMVGSIAPWSLLEHLGIHRSP
jgi:thioredoxin reductase